MQKYHTLTLKDLENQPYVYFHTRRPNTVNMRKLNHINQYINLCLKHKLVLVLYYDYKTCKTFSKFEPAAVKYLCENYLLNRTEKYHVGVDYLYHQRAEFIRSDYWYKWA